MNGTSGGFGAESTARLRREVARLASYPWTAPRVWPTPLGRETRQSSRTWRHRHAPRGSGRCALLPQEGYGGVDFAFEAISRVSTIESMRPRPSGLAPARRTTCTVSYCSKRPSVSAQVGRMAVIFSERPAV